MANVSPEAGVSYIYGDERCGLVTDQSQISDGLVIGTNC